MKPSGTKILSIGGVSIGSLALQRLSAALGKPDLYQSTLSPRVKLEQRWIWTAKGVSAILDENGAVTCLVVDLSLSRVAVQGKGIPATAALFLARFPNAVHSSDGGCRLALGEWCLDAAFQMPGKTAARSSKGTSFVSVRMEKTKRPGARRILAPT